MLHIILGALYLFEGRTPCRPPDHQGTMDSIGSQAQSLQLSVRMRSQCEKGLIRIDFPFLSFPSRGWWLQHVSTIPPPTKSLGSITQSRLPIPGKLHWTPYSSLQQLPCARRLRSSARSASSAPAAARVRPQKV